MIQIVKQNKKAVLAFLLALVMLIGLIPLTATEVQAQTIPIGTVDTNPSFGAGDQWEDGDELYFCRISNDDQWAEYTLTANVENGVTTWTPSEKLYWDDKGEHKLIASYPANLGGGWDNFAIPDDQSTLENLKKADCMNARWAGNPTTDPVNFGLKHRMSMVTVTYTFASEFEDSDVEITPEVYSKAKYITFSDAEGLPMTTSAGRYDAWIKACKHEEKDTDGNIVAKKFTAIVSPDTYSAGDEFIRITVGDQVLTAKMNEAITFQEGTHYTFNLKVGKNKVEIESVSVNDSFSSGWNDEVNLNVDAGVTVGTPDAGKTEWEDGDIVVVDFTSSKYGNELLGVEYREDVWNASFPVSDFLSYLENETPTVSAIYSPNYGIDDFGFVQRGSLNGDGIKDGECEVIKVDCSLSDSKTITVDLSQAKRDYSRLRIVCNPNQTLTVTTTGFTPAGATSEATEAYTLTTDANGNAFLYGTFAEEATVSVKQGEFELANYTFTAEKNPNGTEHNKSYVLDARPVIDGTLGGKTEATEEDLAAMVELLRSYIENGHTTIIVTGSQPAKILSQGYLIPVVSLAFEKLTYAYLEENIDSYQGTVDLIYQDVTEIVEWEFNLCDVLKSITLPNVTTVGDRGFWACYYLETLTFGSLVTDITDNSGEVFYDLGYKIGGCNLVLNSEQVNAETAYQPNIENRTWWNTEWKSITLE